MKPLMFSHGGLISKETAQEYKAVQGELSLFICAWMDKGISMALLHSKALAYGDVIGVS
jgi:hypothetical protein